jgi:3-keto-disaccharide hydrolase
MQYRIRNCLSSLSLSTDQARKLLRRGSHGAGLLLAVWAGSVVSGTAADNDPFVLHEPPPITGRWDLQVRDGSQVYPSWLEVRLSGYRTLVGAYVGQFGSVRPIGEIKLDSGSGDFRFVVPPQWEHRTDDIGFKGKLEGEVLRGETTNDAGQPIHWEARRAPSLDRARPPKWGKAISLFNGHDLSGWKPRHSADKNGWRVRQGVLVNAEPGNDLMTEQVFNDFKLRAEFRYPKGSNSGIYLRGRYEVQIEDNFGLETDSHHLGGVYGFLVPRVNTAKRANEWQTFEITLVGRVVTIVLNGEPIIERQAIPGITGGALDSEEALPGPILIQGDHGQIEFKALALTPAE